MSESSLQSAIYLNEARSETLANQMVDNSETLQLRQKHSSVEIQDIRNNYAPEKERIQNEINGLDKIEQQNEYQDLLTELKDLKEDEEAEIKTVEEQLNDKETAIQLENETLEVQKEEIDTQTESYKEMLKQVIEDNYGYFQ